MISFRTKVTVALILSMLLVAALSNFFIYKFALDSQFQELRDKLMVIAQTAAFAIDVDALMQVPLNRRDGTASAPYKIIIEQLNKIKNANAPIKYIYTMAKTDREGIWQFIVDPDPVNEENAAAGNTAFPGDTYDASRFPALLKAFDGPAADTKLEIDEWGVTLSGYAPLRDRTGKAVAILGVDISADDLYALQKMVHLRGILVLVLGVIISLLLGVFVSHRITARIEALVEGTRRLREGDLQYQIADKGHDEISELVHAFNGMARSLFESRKKMHDYFYRAMQSLVRVLESKDVYTAGHSDRVAEYTQKIARTMGFSPVKVEMLQQAAKLHDIGKLAIQETILNKVGALTQEEIQIIREHPIVGEDILRPVVFDDEVLEMVRSHHEFYDGGGYPDKLKGDNINIFAQVISVADAYDAMTSVRAYRGALTQQEAFEELRRNKGAQFNPAIVDVLIGVLQEASG